MKQEILEIFLKTIVPLLATALFGALMWVAKQLGDWLKEKAKTSKLANVGSVVLTHVTGSVQTVENTMRQMYLEAAADGTITKEEAEAMKKRAIELTLESMSAAAKKSVVDTLGIATSGLPTFLGGVVEKVVAGMPATTEGLPDPKVGATLAAPTGKAADALPFANLPGGLPPP